MFGIYAFPKIMCILKFVFFFFLIISLIRLKLHRLAILRKEISYVYQLLFFLFPACMKCNNVK